MPALTAFATALFNVAENASDKLITLRLQCCRPRRRRTSTRGFTTHWMPAMTPLRPAATAVNTAQRLTQPLQHRKSCQHVPATCVRVLVCTDRLGEGAGGSGGAQACLVPTWWTTCPEAHGLCQSGAPQQCQMRTAMRARPSNSGRSGNACVNDVDVDTCTGR
jgi:hypothetical protein